MSMLTRKGHRVVPWATVRVLSTTSMAQAAAAEELLADQQQVAPKSVQQLVDECLAKGHAGRVVSHFRRQLSSEPHSPLASSVYAHNMVLNRCARDGRADLAQALFAERMLPGEQVTPNEATYGTLVKALCRSGDVPRAYGVVRGMQRGYYPQRGAKIPLPSPTPQANTIVLNTLLNGIAHASTTTCYSTTQSHHASSSSSSNHHHQQQQQHHYCLSPCVANHMADEVFAHVDTPDAFTYAAMVRIRARRGLDEATQLMQDMRIAPSAHVHANLVHAAIEQGDLVHAHASLLDLRKQLLHGDVRLSNAARAARNVVSAYNALMRATSAASSTSSGDMRAAEALLDDLMQLQRTHTHLKPDRISFNTLIAGCATLKDPHHALERAHHWLDLMHSQSIQPDVYTLNGLLGVQRRTMQSPAQLLDGLDALLRQCAPARPNAVTLNVLLSACAEHGDMDTSLRAIEHLRKVARVRPNPVSAKALLKTARMRPEKHAMRIAPVLMSHPTTHTADTLSALAGLLVRQPRSTTLLAHTLEALFESQSQAVAVRVLNQHINACAEEDVAAFKRIFAVWIKLVQARGVFGDRVTFNSLLKGCARHNMPVPGMTTFEQMAKAGVTPDRLSWNPMLQLCLQGGLPEQALHTFTQLMPESGVQPGTDSLNIVLHGLLLQRRVDDAEQLLRIAKQQFDLQWDSTTVYTLVKGYDRLALVHKCMDALREWEARHDGKLLPQHVYLRLLAAMVRDQRGDDPFAMRLVAALNKMGVADASAALLRWHMAKNADGPEETL